jgi:uncharacterized protein (DUF2344 family)
MLLDRVHTLGHMQTCVVHWLQGGFPVAISRTVHPRDQMSAAMPWPCCRITSGACCYVKYVSV